MADLQGLIQSLRDRGMGILITDHNVRETLAITDRATILNDGAIWLQVVLSMFPMILWCVAITLARIFSCDQNLDSLDS